MKRLFFYLRGLLYIAYRLIVNKNLKNSVRFDRVFVKIVTEVLLLDMESKDPQTEMSKYINKFIFAEMYRPSSYSDMGKQHYEQYEKENAKYEEQKKKDEETLIEMLKTQQEQQNVKGENNV